MRKLLIAAALAAAAFSPAAFADEAKYSTKTTTIGALLADEAARKAFEEVLPEVANHPDISQAAEMTLVDVAPMAQGMITDESLKKLDEKLAAIK